MLKLIDYHGEIFCFSECLWFREEARQRPKALPDWQSGVWVGKSMASEEHMLMTLAGLVRTRTAKRKPEGEQYDKELLHQVRGLPWDPMAGEVTQPDFFRAPASGVPSHEVKEETPIQQFLREHGRTPGCSACDGRLGYHHSRECVRRRVEWQARMLAKTSEPEASEKVPVSVPSPTSPEQAARGPDEDQPMHPSVRPRRRISQKRPPQSDEYVGGDESCSDELAHKYRMIEVLSEDSTLSFPVPEESDHPTYLEEIEVGKTDEVTIKTVAEAYGMNWKKVLDGINREVASLKDFRAVKSVPVAKVPQGTKILGTTLVLRPKGFEVKARICAQDFNNSRREDTFSPTPSVLTVRLIFMLSCKYDLTVTVGDFKTAFLHAAMDREVYVWPPKVIQESSEPTVWLLLKALYGIRQSPRLFFQHVRTQLTALGLKCCRCDPTFYFKRSQGGPIFVVIHVDDVLIAARPVDLDWFFDGVGSTMSLKRGSAIGVDEPTKYLGKFYQKLRDGTGYQVWIPEEYFNELLTELRLESAKPAPTPGTTEVKPSSMEEKAIWEDALDDEWAWLYRRSVGKLRFVLEERPDLVFSTQRLSRDLAEPLWSSWQRLRRAARYVAGTKKRRLMILGPGKGEKLRVDTWTDSDYATDVSCRRSVGCVVLFIGRALAHVHGRQQTVVATSSSEAEYYAMSSGAVESLGVSSLLKEIDEPCECTLWCDSSSGRALALREGFGRVKHIDVKMLWLQQVLASDRLSLRAVRGAENLADIGTKYLDSGHLNVLSERLGLVDPSNDGEVHMLCDVRRDAAFLHRLRCEAAFKLRKRILTWREASRSSRAWWQWHLDQADAQDAFSDWCEVQAQNVERVSQQMQSEEAPEDWDAVNLMEEMLVVHRHVGDEVCHVTSSSVPPVAESSWLIELWFWRVIAASTLAWKFASCLLHCCWCPCCRRSSSTTSTTRTVGVQSMTTYTWLRGYTAPRFQVLPEISAGIVVAD